NFEHTRINRVVVQGLVKECDRIPVGQPRGLRYGDLRLQGHGRVQFALRRQDGRITKEYRLQLRIGNSIKYGPITEVVDAGLARAGIAEVEGRVIDVIDDIGLVQG